MFNRNADAYSRWPDKNWSLSVAERRLIPVIRLRHDVQGLGNPDTVAADSHFRAAVIRIQGR